MGRSAPEYSTTEPKQISPHDDDGSPTSGKSTRTPGTSTGNLVKESAESAPVALEPSVSPPAQVEIYPSTWKLVAIMIGLSLAVFLVSLDNTILATAVPKITDQFNSLDDVGWYGSTFLLTNCAVSLLFGKLYTIFSIKWVFLCALTVFEIGSLLCGIAPNSVTLIVGRAIAGLGGSGIFSGATLIIAQSVPLHQRALCTGLASSLYAIAGVTGPLLGGALTDYVSWRWCFYINLPLGGVTLVFIFLFTKAQKPVKETAGLKEKLAQLDPIGLVLLLPAVVCLLLALQWGGSTYPWDNGRVIALLVVFGMLLLAFVAVQCWQQDQATIPLRLLRNRNISGASFFIFCLNASFMVFTYYMPIWFQSIKGVSATWSGILSLPMLGGVAICMAVSGGVVTAFGQYMPFLYFAPIATSIAAGLLSTLHVSSKSSEYLGYQALYGIGYGCGATQPLMVVQAALSPTDIPSGTVIMIFMQTISGAIFISVAQNMFHNKLLANLARDAPEINASDVVATGATMLRSLIPDESIPTVLRAYSSAITYSFYVAVALAALALFGTLPLQWLSMKKKTSQPAH